MEKLLISACLTGVNCKYNGGNNLLDAEVLAALRERFELVPVCPEMLGGLPAPREPGERILGRVVSQSGRDVTAEYTLGAAEAVHIAHGCGCTKALLKERSPSCGSGEIYDGSFSHTVVPGDGVTAELLKQCGIAVAGESTWTVLLAYPPQE